MQSEVERKPLEAVLYVDVATSLFNAGIPAKEQFDEIEVAEAFCDIYNANRRLVHFRVARGPSPSGLPLEVSDAEANVDEGASDDLLDRVHMKLWNVIAFA